MSTNEPTEPPLFTRQPDTLYGQALDRKIQELADREEIRELVATYAHRVAHGLSVADLFTDDGAYIQKRSPQDTATEVRGRAAIDAHYVERPDSVGSATPMIHNLLLSLDGETAQGVCSIELRIADSGANIFASGYYRDKLRRENRRWKFVERAVTFFRWGPAGQD